MPLYQVNGITGKYLTSSSAVTTVGKPGLLFGYVLGAGSTATSITFKDGGSGGTTKWVDSVAGQTAAGDISVMYTFNEPLIFTTDMYATLAGTNAFVSIAYYELG